MNRNIMERWWVWIIPLALVLGIFFLYPLLNVIRLSFSNATIGTIEDGFTFENYIHILTGSGFWQVMKVTLVFVFASVLFQLLLGLITAILINKDLFGSSLVKLSMITAWVVPGIITGVIWSIMYSSSSWGILNYFIRLLGLNQIPFLYTPSWALFSVVLANVWRGTGFSGIMQYAALRGIPDQLYEAASIDGASTWQQFWNITLPQLKPMLMINTILITIYTFNTYDSIFALTQGGPGNSTTVLSLGAYKQVFRYLNLGRGSAYAVIMLILSGTFTILYAWFMGSDQ
ncbi:carbohydrate ABC transporter permease [Halanaerobium kushneri]|uniref:Carbohydrate ABC transporter membrane protein 1, CUT1 family n=1 Tax=Halanaerobium kushneri TaxID=56779 RepID=A0A1N6RUN0_9FIRM|nr:sugar ABC transporter permease [Halanaerobium kushneri]SIQ32574.1 carbohydrate ABC transporter membrane protein 1, CUT1 family [Halanaerobium kushneri]